MPSSVSGTAVDKPAITTPPQPRHREHQPTMMTKTTRLRRKTRMMAMARNRRRRRRFTITVPHPGEASRRIVHGRCGTGKHSWESGNSFNCFLLYNYYFLLLYDYFFHSRSIYIFKEKETKYVDMCEKPVKHIPTNPIKSVLAVCFA